MRSDAVMNCAQWVLMLTPDKLPKLNKASKMLVTILIFLMKNR